MPSDSPSRKYLLVNSETMASIALDEHQMRMIILGLVGFSAESGPDAQPATDLADTVSQLVGSRILKGAKINTQTMMYNYPDGAGISVANFKRLARALP